MCEKETTAMILLMLLALLGTFSGLISGAYLGGADGLILGASSGLVLGTTLWLLTGSVVRALHEYRINRYFTQDSFDDRGY
jgi:hypothetical protein